VEATHKPPTSAVRIGNGHSIKVIGAEGTVLDVESVVRAKGIRLRPGVIAKVADTAIGRVAHIHKDSRSQNLHGEMIENAEHVRRVKEVGLKIGPVFPTGHREVIHSDMRAGIGVACSRNIGERGLTTGPRYGSNRDTA